MEESKQVEETPAATATQIFLEIETPIPVSIVPKEPMKPSPDEEWEHMSAMERVRRIMEREL